MRAVLCSDLHMNFPDDLPDGDLVVMCGDYSYRGTIQETNDFNEWLASLPHRYKIFIAGNHDFIFQNNKSLAKNMITAPDTFYLEDSGIELQGIKIWGTPWTPTFYDWAFMLDDESPQMEARMKVIPSGLDLLISHGPPKGILSMTTGGDDAGCSSLLAAIERAQPRFVACGHIHEGYGQQQLGSSLIINCSLLNERYRRVNAPVIIDL